VTWPAAVSPLWVWRGGSNRHGRRPGFQTPRPIHERRSTRAPVRSGGGRDPTLSPFPFRYAYSTPSPSSRKGIGTSSQKFHRLWLTSG
jgi:hypothetical protein